MKLCNEGNTATIFQFDDAETWRTGTAEAIVLNDSLSEQYQFETDLKPRYGRKAIVKRQAGALNRNFTLKVLFTGTARDTLLASFISALDNNDFIYLDTENLQTRLDGVYAPTASLTQKKDETTETILATVQLVEKE